MNAKKTFLFLILSLVGLCGCESDKYNNPTLYYKLPIGATNLVDRGNEWHTFDLTMDGSKRTFLHKWSSDNSGNETITELTPR